MALPDQGVLSDTAAMSCTVLSAEFAHETNTFSQVHTTHAHFMARSRCLQGDAAIAARGHANTELGGFLEVARTHGWQLIHVLSASANPGGLVTEDAFERLAGLIVDAAHRHRDALELLIGCERQQIRGGEPEPGKRFLRLLAALARGHERLLHLRDRARHLVERRPGQPRSELQALERVGRDPGLDGNVLQRFGRLQRLVD